MVGAIQAGQVEAAQHAGEAGLQALVGTAAGFVEGGDDEVLEHLDVGGIRTQAGDRRGVDLQREHLLLAIHLHGDGAAAGGSFDDRRGEALIHLLLHLLRLAQHFLDVLRIQSMSFPMACP